MRVKSVIGALPSRVFKAYKEEDHARVFAEKGIIHLGQIQSYREIEDRARRDENEGEGFMRVPDQITSMHFDAATLEPIHTSVAPGYLNHMSTFTNPAYLFCIAGERVDISYLRSTMGPHVVEIFDTPSFLQSFSNALAVEPITDRIGAFAETFEVRYDKGEIREAGNYPDALCINIAQKSKRFARECEWRIAVVMDDLNKYLPNTIFLNLANSTSFARLL